MANDCDVMVAEPDELIEELARTLDPTPARFGRYEVIEAVGEGAMSCVYRAFDPATGRSVALKVLRPAPWLTGQAGDCRRRFFQEAQAAGGLSHPNIVVIFDVDRDFFVMEFLHGETLRSLLDRRGRLSLEEALPILEGVADALDYAHRKGVVHRDVKPGNIMVLPDGRPKVMDFGVAHLDSMAVTAPGQCLGSPLYMSPEQIEGTTVTAQSDVFALAAVAYEMLTGRKAFAAPTLPAIVRRVLEDEPEPATSIVPELPARCDEAIARGLRKAAAPRFATAAALVDALRGHEAPVRRRVPRPVRPAPRLPGMEETQDLRLLDVTIRPQPLRLASRTMSTLRAQARGFSLGLVLLFIAVPLISSSWTPLAGPMSTGPAAVASAVPVPSGRETAKAPAAPAEAPATGSVPVLSDPEGAVVWVDGKPAGKTPLVLEGVTPGLHQVKLAARGYAPVEMELALEAGDRAPLAFRLQRLPAATPEVRIVRVAAPMPTLREGEMVPFGPDVQAPTRISGKRANYPEKAYPAEGLVKLEATITENGEAIDVTLLESPHPALARAVLEAVRTWRFDPARKNGVRVRVRWPIEHRFVIAPR